LAERALRVAEGDEALALVQSERSGMARFAGSEVHQPTLIENETVELQVVRDGRLGIATGNRTDDDGLRALASRAAEAAESAPPDPDFPGLAPPAETPAVEGYDEEAAALGADDQARPAAAAVEPVEKAKLTRGAVELEPGPYPAVLEAPAFAELLAYFAFDAFGALGLVEERSYAFDTLGQP